MPKNKNKTQPTKQSVSAFLNSIEDVERRKDCKTVSKLMQEITKHKPKMWGTSIVGFGEYHYKYDSGREGDFLRMGFSPRKAALTIYIMPGYTDYSEILAKLGPYKKGKSCLYIKRLSDIHMPTLKKLIRAGWKDMLKLYPIV